MNARIYFVTIFLLYSINLNANLCWDTLTIKRRVQSDEKIVNSSFKFKNVGSEDVEIISVKSSCGCIVSELENKIYKPKEVGELNVSFNVATRTGFQSKEIHIETSDGKIEKLLLEYIFLQPLIISKNILRWNIGAEPIPKDILVTINLTGERSFNITNVKSSTPDFDVSYEKLNSGDNSIEITVRPFSTGKPKRANIEIVTDLVVNGMSKIFTFEAIVGNDNTNSSKIANISYDTLLQLMNTYNIVLLDARPSIFYNMGCIPNALNFPTSQFDAYWQNFVKDNSLENILIVYCSDSDCDDSSKLAYMLKENGAKNVMIYKGGWKEWKDANK